MEGISDGAGVCATVSGMHMLRPRGSHEPPDSQEPRGCPGRPAGSRAETYPWAHLPGTLLVWCPLLWLLVRTWVPLHCVPWKEHWQSLASRLLCTDPKLQQGTVRACGRDRGPLACCVWLSAFSLSSQPPPFPDSQCSIANSNPSLPIYNHLIMQTSVSLWPGGCV